MAKLRVFARSFGQRGRQSCNKNYREKKKRSKKRNQKSDEPRTLLRWGIAPISLIGDDFATALSTLPKEQHQLTACVACYKSMADAFAQKHKVPKVYTSFYDFAKCRDVDVVYISPLNPLHLELGKLMLNNGKHLLCEKPLCMNEEQSIQLIGQSHCKRRFLMEAMWTRFLPAYQFIRDQIDSCALGEIVEVDCSFGMPLLHMERMVKRSLGGGVTLGFGIYPIQLAQWVFRMPPYKITADGNLNDDGVDIEADINLDYGCGRSATIKLSACQQYDNIAKIVGSKGSICVPEYWGPTKLIVDGKEKKFPLPKTDLRTNFPNRIGLAFEAEEVRKCLLRKRNQSEKMNHNESLLIARIKDQIRKKIGVTYPEDQYS